ncbi:unannotated protein [freshwater metagenome]|uniref:Unannotated protein n=1 Tax=freshwater metagenome TaxID=449393 RepID=A0A6J7QD55_9ZZZZ
MIPLNTAAAPNSARTICELVSVINSSPGETRSRIESWFAKEPDVQKSAASLPNKFATFSSSALTVGSSPYTSSPTGAEAITVRISSEGLVTVSDLRSIWESIIL